MGLALLADDVYTLKVVRYQTPFTTTDALRFAGDRLTIDREENVGAADARVSQIAGRRDAR